MKKLLTLIAAVALGAAAALAADTSASFPGGDAAMKQYLHDNLHYSDMAREMGIEGVVELEFTVKPAGSIGAIKVKRMLDPELEQEAIRLVKNMPVWTPATHDGTPVESRASVAITFELPD